MKNSSLLILSVVLLVIGAMGLLVFPCLFAIDGTGDTGESYNSLGEKIYFSGRGENGKAIPYDDGPHWFRMHGGACATCHGDDGKGGFQLMMSEDKAPAITWDALTKKDHDEHENEEKHGRYTEKKVKRAITKGLDPDGKKLDTTMPRWEMNKKERGAVIDFLKEL